MLRWLGIIFGTLRSSLQSKYVRYYNDTRTLLYLAKDATDPPSVQPPSQGRVVAMPRVDKWKAQVGEGWQRAGGPVRCLGLSSGRMIDLLDCTLEPLHEDGELILYRAVHASPADGVVPSVLVVGPAGEYVSPATLARL